MSIAEKVLEQFPYAKGSAGRRFITGLIFTFVFLIHYLSLSPQVDLTQESVFVGLKLKEIVESTQLLFIAVGFVFAVGSIIDAITDGFIFRGVSISINWVKWFYDRVPKEGIVRHWTLVAVLILLTFLLSPLAVIIATILSSIGFLTVYLYKMDLADSSNKWLSKNAADYYKESEKLLPCIGELDKPFGDKYEAAWQALSASLPDYQKLWINQVESRNRDLASFLAAVQLAIVISMSLLIANNGITTTSVVSYLVICFLSYLMFGCFSLIRRAIVSLIEIAAISSSMGKG